MVTRKQPSTTNSASSPKRIRGKVSGFFGRTEASGRTRRAPETGNRRQPQALAASLIANTGKQGTERSVQSTRRVPSHALCSQPPPSTQGVYAPRASLSLLWQAEGWLRPLPHPLACARLGSWRLLLPAGFGVASCWWGGYFGTVWLLAGGLQASRSASLFSFDSRGLFQPSLVATRHECASLLLQGSGIWNEPHNHV